MTIDSIPAVKRCSKCGEEKPISAFTRSSAYSDGYRGQCTRCRIGYNHKWEKGWFKTRKGALSRLKTRRKTRWKSIARLYGMSEADWHALFVEQGSCCAICGTVNAGGRHNRFVVDHCHKSKRVRGILCVRCNRKLARFGDDLEEIAPYVDYLYSTAALQVGGRANGRSRASMGDVAQFCALVALAFLVVWLAGAHMPGDLVL